MMHDYLNSQHVDDITSDEDKYEAKRKEIVKFTVVNSDGRAWLRSERAESYDARQERIKRSVLKEMKYRQAKEQVINVFAGSIAKLLIFLKIL